MATRTQFQFEAVPGCIHEQLCQAVYEQQHKRIQALCRWMAPDAAEARQLAFLVFVEAWRHPGQAWPAISSDHLAERFAARFRWLFHSDAVPLPAAAPGPRRMPEVPAEPLRAAVTALPSAHRLLYLLHELEGYSPETLSAWLDVPAPQCARMIHEARVQIRRRLRAS